MKKLWENKKKYIKGERNVLGYNLIKFDVVSLNSILKIFLNLENMSRQT
jgi:hypothetical protein